MTLRLDAIEDPIADDTWSYRDVDGALHRARILIGRPTPIPGDKNGDWYCPVSIEGILAGVDCFFGVGPVDALLNASNFVREVFSSLEEVTPRS